MKSKELVEEMQLKILLREQHEGHLAHFEVEKTRVTASTMG